MEKKQVRDLLQSKRQNVKLLSRRNVLQINNANPEKYFIFYGQKWIVNDNLYPVL